MSPAVTIVMANHNGAAFIEAALRSALAQTLRDIEIVVADDASTDDSAARIAAVVRGDARVRLLRSPCNGGPAAARNRCLDAARGRWIAIMDSDDLMHPARLDRLVAAAERDGADIVADDLLMFHDDGARGPETCLHGAAAKAPRWVDAAAYVRANLLFGGARALGYLKPIIRAELTAALRYDPRLRIGEDCDFILRLLAAGARFRIYPDLTYFYRKHAQSVSHRLSHETLEPMLRAHDRIQAALAGRDTEIDAAMALRRASILRALDFEALLAALKQRDWRRALVQAWRQPRVAALLRGPVNDRLRRRVGSRATKPAGDKRHVCVLSRQRVVGNTRGSSAYLLSLCEALRRSGCDVHLIWPSPAVFGRWPALILLPEMGVFRSIHLRGSVRVGSVLLATNPMIALRAAFAVLGTMASRVGIPAGWLTRPAPYSISEPWTQADFLFVARHAHARADVIVADYAFLTEAIPYVLRPDAPSLVVMHDLFSSRSALFGQLGALDSVARIDELAEMALLGRASAIVAIQAAEAAIVRRHVPNRRIIVAPMAIAPVAAAQPGSGRTVLFVGTETAPNAVSLRWFIDAIWPAIRHAAPDATLTVAGSVGRTVTSAPPGVRLLGNVPDLSPLYRDAAVVISPLLAGSGLKIKLVEALGHGKAIVATTTTLQGVEDVARGGVVVADEPTAFAAAVARFLVDEALRARYGAAALHIARTRFSAEACTAELSDFVMAREPLGLAPSSAAD